MGPWPMTRTVSSGWRVEIVDGFVGGVDGLNKGGLFEGDAVGNFDEGALDDPGHDADVLGESAARGLEAGGAADPLVIVALGEGFFAAIVTMATGSMVVDHDAVTDGQSLDAFADGGNDASGLVTENAGGGMGAGVDLFKVGAADATGRLRE